MKKFYFIMLIAALFSFISCEKEKPAINEQEPTVENIISMDREYMRLACAEDYRWYETSIVLNDLLDSEECDGSVASITSVFQFLVDQDSTSCNVMVVLYTHVSDTTIVEQKEGFWVGDHPLNDELIEISFKEAYEKVMEANYPKPHSRQVVLRKEIGFADCNPQYIFGNTESQLYVDAKTGEVTDENPAFKGVDIKTSLDK